MRAESSVLVCECLADWPISGAAASATFRNSNSRNLRSISLRWVDVFPASSASPSYETVTRAARPNRIAKSL